MYDIFTRLLNMSLTASVMILAIIIFRFCLKKIPRKYICVLWGLVAIRLICPISISSALSVFNLTSLETNETGQIEYFQYTGHTEKPEVVFQTPNLFVSEQETNPVSVTKHTSDLYLPTIVSLWLIGVVAMLGYSLISYLRLRKEVSASIRRQGNVYVCDEIKTPFILGIVNPRIYLPTGMAQNTEQHVLAHEKAHIERHDHWWKPVGFLLLSVYWFNPLMWVAYILLCRDIEVACDEKVIEKMDRDGIVGYSMALLECAAQRKLITVCPLAFGEEGAKQRIKTILDYKKPAFWVVLLAVLAVVVAGVLFLTNPLTEKEEVHSEPENTDYSVKESSSEQDMKQEEVSIVATYEHESDAAGYYVLISHYEMSDGTWRTDTGAYKYRLIIEGTQGSQQKKFDYIYLSNIEEISYHEAMMASGLSSYMPDYFDEATAKFVGFRTENNNPYTFEIISNAEEASEHARLSCQDENGNLLWEYSSDEVYVSELDVIQDIGLFDQGYVFLAGGKVYCIETRGKNAGTVKWVNIRFKGASACHLRSEETPNILYLVGYYGPDLMAIDLNTGVTKGRYDKLDYSEIPDADPDEFIYPVGINWRANRIEISYDLNRKTAVVDPATGKVVSVYSVNDKAENDNSHLDKTASSEWQYLDESILTGNKSFEKGCYFIIMEEKLPEGEVFYKTDESFANELFSNICSTPVKEESFTVGKGEKYFLILHDETGAAMHLIEVWKDTICIDYSKCYELGGVELYESVKNIIGKSSKLQRVSKEEVMLKYAKAKGYGEFSEDDIFWDNDRPMLLVDTGYRNKSVDSTAQVYYENYVCCSGFIFDNEGTSYGIEHSVKLYENGEQYDSLYAMSAYYDMFTGEMKEELGWPRWFTDGK